MSATRHLSRSIGKFVPICQAVVWYKHSGGGKDEEFFQSKESKIAENAGTRFPALSRSNCIQQEDHVFGRAIIT